jgi:hypothetical protein
MSTTYPIPTLPLGSLVEVSLYFHSETGPIVGLGTVVRIWSNREMGISLDRFSRSDRARLQEWFYLSLPRDIPTPVDDEETVITRQGPASRKRASPAPTILSRAKRHKSKNSKASLSTARSIFRSQAIPPPTPFAEFSGSDTLFRRLLDQLYCGANTVRGSSAETKKCPPFIKRRAGHPTQNDRKPL